MPQYDQRTSPQLAWWWQWRPPHSRSLLTGSSLSLWGRSWAAAIPAEQLWLSSRLLLLAVITSPGQRKDTDREILVASVMKYWPRMWFKLTYSGDIKKNFILNFASAQNQVCNTSNKVVQIYIQDFVLVRFVIFSNTDWLCLTLQWKKFWLNFSFSVE